MNQDDFQLPEAAQTAFENYPQIEPSDAFNHAIFERLEAQKVRRRGSFIGRIEEFLGLDLWQFAASGMLGALLPALLLGALCLSNRAAAPANAPAPTLPSSPLTPFRAMGPFYAREWELSAGYSDFAPSQPPRGETKPQPQKEISCVDSMSHWA